MLKIIGKNERLEHRVILDSFLRLGVFREKIGDIIYLLNMELKAK